MDGFIFTILLFFVFLILMVFLIFSLKGKPAMYLTAIFKSPGTVSHIGYGALYFKCGQ